MPLYTLWGILVSMNFIPMKYVVLGSFISIVAGVVFIQLQHYGAYAQNVTQENTKVINIFTPNPNTVIEVPVSGKIQPVNTAIVSARSSGVVNEIFLSEGSVVRQGSVLFKQDSSVYSEMLILENNKGLLQDTKNQSKVDLNYAKSIKSDINKHTTEKSAKKRTLSSDENIKNSIQQLVAGMNKSVTQIIFTLDFIDNNRNLLTSIAAQRYVEIVSEIYGKQPLHLGHGVIYQTVSTNNLLDQIVGLQNSDVADVDKIFELSNLLVEQLHKIENMLIDVESEFLDEDQLNISDNIYSQYKTHRRLINTNRVALHNLQLSVSQKNIQGVKVNISETANIELSTKDSAFSNLQLQHSKNIALQSSVVNNSNIDVLKSKIELSKGVALFAGIVQEVFVDVGEYVQAGTPVMSIMGYDGLDLSVRVPAHMLLMLNTGQELMINDKLVGSVIRFSPTIVRGSVEVFIGIKDNMFVSGDIVSGEILVNTNMPTIAKIPRTHLHFSTTGAYVVTVEQEKIPVTVLFDKNTILYIKSEESLTHGLMPAFGK